MADDINWTPALEGTGTGPERASLMVVIRSNVRRLRARARLVAEGTHPDLADETEGRLRHLELALDQAYERIAALEALAQETLGAIDHQGSRLESYDGEFRRLLGSQGPVHDAGETT